MSNGSWISVSKKAPCPICGKCSWCRTGTDGCVVQCERQSIGAIREKLDRNGNQYWVHKIGPIAAPYPYQATLNQAAPPSLSPEQLNLVYSQLLILFPLHPIHHKALKTRGLDNAQIALGNYGTLPLKGRSKIAKLLVKKFGPDFCKSVPGLYQKKSNDGTLYWTIAGRPGLLIPVRDLNQFIIALKIRHDSDNEESSRYSTLSSAAYQGCGPGQQVHVPAYYQENPDVIRVTEGELKADISTHLSAIWTISAPGVTGWRMAIQTIKQIGAKTIKLAFDEDAGENQIVATAQKQFSDAIRDLGLNLEVETWDRNFKGIDDALAAKTQIKTLTGDGAMTKINEDLANSKKQYDTTEAKQAELTSGQSECEGGNSQASSVKTSVVNKIMEIAGKAEYFSTPSKEPYAKIPVDEHIEIWPIDRHGPFKDWLINLYFKQHKSPPGEKALKEAIETLSSTAIYSGQKKQVFRRTAELDGKIYIDLNTDDWKVAEIDENGWSILEKSPVNFIRSTMSLPLPMPQKNGNIGDLKKLLNLGSDDDFKLIVGCLLTWLNPHGPYPILSIHGEQGSAKSTVAKTIKSLIDSEDVPVVGLPQNEENLAVAAQYSWVQGFDNVSEISPTISDALCRLSTGGGLKKRTLYTNAGLSALKTLRPVLLNGIEGSIDRADLASRAISIELPRIDDRKRKFERDLEELKRDLFPGILGSLFDAISVGLRNISNCHLDSVSRMADAIRWVTAAEESFGWAKNSFAAAYNRNRQNLVAVQLESSPIYEPIIQLLEKHGGGWRGTMSDLLQAISECIDYRLLKISGLPTSPIALSRQLTRLAPNLRAVGIEIVRLPRKSEERIIEIRRVIQEPFTLPSACSTTSVAEYGAGISNRIGHDGYDNNDKILELFKPERTYVFQDET